MLKTTYSDWTLLDPFWDPIWDPIWRVYLTPSGEMHTVLIYETLHVVCDV